MHAGCVAASHEPSARSTTPPPHLDPQQRHQVKVQGLVWFDAQLLRSRDQPAAAQERSDAAWQAGAPRLLAAAFQLCGGRRLAPPAPPPLLSRRALVGTRAKAPRAAPATPPSSIRRCTAAWAAGSAGPNCSVTPLPVKKSTSASDSQDARSPLPASPTVRGSAPAAGSAPPGSNPAARLRPHAHLWAAHVVAARHVLQLVRESCRQDAGHASAERGGRHHVSRCGLRPKHGPHRK